MKKLFMKEMERRELELLAKVCYKNEIPLKLAKDLIKTAKKLSYENATNGARMMEYDELIRIHKKDK